MGFLSILQMISGGVLLLWEQRQYDFSLFATALLLTAFCLKYIYIRCKTVDCVLPMAPGVFACGWDVEFAQQLYASITTTSTTTKCLLVFSDIFL